MSDIEMTEDFIFEGFDKPSENWSKLPHVFMNFLPQITSLSELKVVLYILRHTWGYQEFNTPRRITVDEFMHGRKTKDNGRIDEGTGMSEPSIRDGLKRAEKHGFITIDVNDNDKARVEKSYQLNMNQGERSLPPEGKKFTPREKKVLPRSGKETSKETKKQFISSAVANGKKPRPLHKNAPWHDALLECFGLTPETVTTTGDKTYWVAAADLAKITFPVDRIADLHEWCTDQDWPNFTVMALAKHAGEWLAEDGDDGSDPFAKTFEGLY